AAAEAQHAVRLAAAIAARALRRGHVLHARVVVVVLPGVVPRVLVAVVDLVVVILRVVLVPCVAPVVERVVHTVVVVVPRAPRATLRTPDRDSRHQHHHTRDTQADRPLHDYSD